MIPFIRFQKNLLAVLLLAFASFNFVSCREDEFDEPPINGADPNIPVNMTIDSLKKMYTGTIFTIDSNWVIAGVVTADDKSGNFYKTMVIEDATAGISIRLDMSDYNVEYPIGRRVFVKLKGLVVGDYGGLVQIGGFIDNTGTTPSAAPIPLSLVSEHIFGGEYNLNPQPTDVNINELSSNTDKWQNRFIELDSSEFDVADTAKPYADAIGLTYGEYPITQCTSTGSILLRTSGYSTFATKLTPGGNGKIRGICTIYGGTLQLIIRDDRDVNMPNLRCNAIVGPATPITVAALRALFTGTTSVITSNYYINGVVISDKSTSNLNAKNLFIQDATGGICVRFAANHTFNLGDSLKVIVAGQSLGEFSGLLQVGTSTPSVPLANATVLATGKTVTPQVVTVSQILANMASTDSWEGSLLTIQGATITGGATYSGSVQITDPSGVMTLYTASGATFSGTALPAGTVNITGILTDYNGTVTAPNTNAQLQIRNTTDVQ